MQHFLGTPALQELPNLTADRCHDLQEIGILLTNLVAEELDDTQERRAEQDGKREGRMKPRVDRRRRPWEIGVARDIGNPAGSATAPHPARQPDAGLERPIETDAL